jgi:AcrR family transcriptional regulator
VTQAHIDARTSDIADAANRVFAAKGFDGATMAEIAAEAGLSTGAIYRYFPSKEAIIEAMSVERRERYERIVSEVRAEGRDAPATIQRLGEVFFAPLEAAENLAPRSLDIALCVESSRNAAVREAMLAGMALLLDRFETIARAGQEAGEVRRDLSARAIAEIMMALHQGLVVQLTAGVPIDVRRYVQTMVRIMATGVRGERGEQQEGATP